MATLTSSSRVGCASRTRVSRRAARRHGGVCVSVTRAAVSERVSGGGGVNGATRPEGPPKPEPGREPPLEVCGDVAKERALEAAEWLLARIDTPPQVAIVCGSGLGVLADDVEDAVSFECHEVPWLPEARVMGHSSRLVFGNLHGKPVVVMQGRVHLYEGWSFEEATRAIRAFKYMGVNTLLLTNAVGALNQDYEVGDLVNLTDHMGLAVLAGKSPLAGPCTHGARFVDMAAAYSPELCRAVAEKAEELDIPLRQGVMAYAFGPSFETPAECRALRMLGGDVVGMSVIPEVIVARFVELTTCCISIVSNVSVLEVIQDTTTDDELHKDVLNQVEEIGVPRARKLIEELIPTFAKGV